MQSSTIFEVHTEVVEAVKCTYHTHLLAYAPAEKGSCREDAEPNSFIAFADPYGRVIRAHYIKTPNGARYNGSLTSLAVDRSGGTVWACGHLDGAETWSLHSFRLSDLDVLENKWKLISKFGGEEAQKLLQGDIMSLFPAMPSYDERAVTMCGSFEQLNMPVTSTCSISFDDVESRLWLADGASGNAWKASTAQACNVRPSFGSTASFGQNVVAFSFMKDLLNDKFLTLAKCPHTTQPCQLDFFKVKDGVSTAEVIMSIRVPPRISSLAHNTMLGSEKEGGAFVASFIGMTPDHVEEAQTTTMDPEDRVHVFRTPILQTAFVKAG